MVTSEVKKARITAVIMGVLSGLTLIAFVYAFIQQSEAERQAKLVEQLINENTQWKQNDKRIAKQLDRQNEELKLAYEEIRNALNDAQDKLKKCNCK